MTSANLPDELRKIVKAFGSADAERVRTEGAAQVAMKKALDAEDISEKVVANLRLKERLSLPRDSILRIGSSVQSLVELQRTAGAAETAANEIPVLQKSIEETHKRQRISNRRFALVGAVVVVIAVIIGILKVLDILQQAQIQSIRESSRSMITIAAGNANIGCTTQDGGCASDAIAVDMVTLVAYEIDMYEVTNEQYTECVTTGKCTSPSDSSSSTRNDYYTNSSFAVYPVINVDWNQAKTYCEWAGKRLPTEAEWVRAARSTTGRVYPWGDTEPTCALANYSNCIGDTDMVGNHASGISTYGVMDMAGNVWEWTADWYDKKSNAKSPANNPEGSTEGQYRVIRGGSWNTIATSLRVGFRNGNSPDYKHNNLGFRCAR